MRVLLLAGLMVAIGSGVSFADEDVPRKTYSTSACLDLQRQAEAGLESKSLDSLVRQRLQELLDTARNGDMLACQNAANGALSTPKQEPRACDKPTA